MNRVARLLIPDHAPEQALRLKRVLLGGVSYLFTLLLVLAFWWLGYFDGKVVVTYVAIILTVNLGFYLLVRSGLNLRFADPSLTLAQIAISLPTGLYVMYYARDARGVFLLLSLSASMYGLFQFRTRDFVILTTVLLGGYAALIVSLMARRPHEINLQIEILQLIALAAALLQFSALGSYIGGLRHKVKEKNQELAKRNVELEQALHRNQELAIRDELTGVFNRRYLMEIISREKQRSDRTGRVFSICIVDVDFFKKVNDTYGHLAGDEVLRTIARTASDAMRQTDYFGRYGGEEFALVLTDTMVEGALITAERVRLRIENLSFPEINADLKVTVSIGIADSRRNEDTSATFRHADQALYHAKENGRNQSVVAGLRTLDS
ncbi:MAG TPA: GGDEF domain-containing protein [Oxalobacteraceae bacterium]|nr:GGDEF domain-containing protein [Oxalobacteraceae bacterium]